MADVTLQTEQWELSQPAKPQVTLQTELWSFNAVTYTILARPIYFDK